MVVIGVIGMFLIVGGPVSLWRMFDWGPSYYMPPRLGGSAALIVAAVGAWIEFGALAGVAVTLLSLGTVAVAFMPTPHILRKADLFRSRDVREAVEKTATLWDSFDYRPSELE